MTLLCASISNNVKYDCLIIVAYMSSICSANRIDLSCSVISSANFSFNNISAKTEAVSAKGRGA